MTTGLLTTVLVSIFLNMYSFSAFQRAEARMSAPIPPPRRLLLGPLHWVFVLCRFVVQSTLAYHLQTPVLLIASVCVLAVSQDTIPLYPMYIFVAISLLSLLIVFYHMYLDRFRRVAATGLSPLTWFLSHIYKLIGLSLYLSPSDALSFRLRWELFWVGYFILADRKEFHQDVVESLCRNLRKQLPMQKPGHLIPLLEGQAPELWSFMVVIHNGPKIEIPCAAELDDQEFVRHLEWFRTFLKIEKGLLANLSILSLSHMEIAKMASDSEAGETLGILEIGRTSSNRIVHLFSNSINLEGNARVRKLVEQGVLGRKGEARDHCLNLVYVWSTGAAGVIAGTPLVISVLCCILWPVVAVLRYGADIQTSVQTGVSVGSFVATVSALLIAFVAFLDTSPRVRREG